MRALAFTVIWTSLSASVVHCLPALTSCAAGGRAGRPGFCAASVGDVDSPVVQLRGTNYIRLGGPNLSGYHSTFDVGVYNRSRYVAAFKQLQRDGFNINRVFLDELPNRGIGGPTNATAPLDAAWLDRLAQYVSDAEAHGIYTMITMVYCPDNAYFRAFKAAKFPPESAAWAGSWNGDFLSVTGQGMFTEYAGQLAAALKARLAPASQAATLVSLQNEFFLDGSAYPFNVQTGSLKMADGVLYNLASPPDRQQAADANTNLWARRARVAIRTHLPSTLVTAGVFTFKAVQKPGPNGLILPACDASAPHPIPKTVDCRFPARPLKLAQSGLDYLDVHIYEADGSPAALDANLVTEEWDKVPATLPVMMGEFGCNWNWYENATACMPHVRDLQVSSCGRGFTGWLYWQYDCEVQADWYTQVDGAGAINSVLSPAANPDPCKAETGKGDQSDWGAIRDPATEKAVGGDAIAARAVGGSDSVQLQL